MKNRLVAKIITGTVLVGALFVGAMVAPKTVRADEFDENTEFSEGDEEINEDDIDDILIGTIIGMALAEAAEPAPAPVPAPKPEYVPVKGISVSQTSVNFKNEGDTITIQATVNPTNANNTRIHWCSSNPAVASVDNGYIRAFANGTATITATTDEGNYSAYINVTVGSGKTAAVTTVQPATTADNKVSAAAVAQILNAKKNGTATIITTEPSSFDMNVALAMAARPDVKVDCIFPYGGHNFKLTLPKGYNLSKTMNAQGCVTWLELCKYNGIGGVKLQMLN